MITISLPYNVVNTTRLDSLRKQYSNIVKFSYNRFREDIKQKDVRNLISNLNNVNDLNSWLKQCALKEGEALHIKNKDNKVIFGGKNLFYRRLKGLISKEEYKNLKQYSIGFA